MAAIRLSCATLFAGLLVVSPAPAEEVKKPTDTQAKPQAIKKQQSTSTPTLPANVRRADQPTGAPSGGAAGSINTGKPVAPVGAQTIGGQATGGSATTPATTTTSSQPTSGSTLVNPNAKTDQTGGALPGDFSREKKLQGVVDGGAGAVKSDAASKEGSAPGRTSGADAIKEAGALPGPGAGKNTVSKTGMTSDKTDDTPEVTKAKNEGAAELLRREGGTPTGNWQKDIREVEYAQKVGTDGYAATKNLNETERANYWNAQKIIQGTGTKGRPAPDSDTGDGHGPKNMVGTDKPKPTPAELEAERKRQVTLSNDDKQQVERMKADERAAAATMGARRANAINPGEQAAPVVTGSGQPPPQRGVESGQPQNPSKSGGKPTCPADNPSC